MRFDFTWTFIKNYFSIFNIILLIITGFNIYQFIKEPKIVDLISIIIILTMVIISGSIGFFQALNNFFITKKILHKNKRYVKVIRNSDMKFDDIIEENINYISKQTEKIDCDNLVVGDIVYLTAGDVIGADLKIIYENNFSVSQASLSGETFPVDKSIINTKENMLDFENICYAGTVVSTGYAIAVVFATGKYTYQVKISNKIKKKPKKTVFEKCLNRISLFIVSFMAVVVPIVLMISKFINGNNWSSSLLYSISLAVGLTPEMLPIIVTLNLTRGFKQISSHLNANVKNLNSVQALGSIDVLCMDKTGTITEGEISLHKALNFYGKRSEELNIYSFINANYQSGFINQIDSAIIKRLDIYEPTSDEIKIIGEKPFDFDRKLLSIHANYKGQKIQITKGAPEEISNLITKISLDDDNVRNVKPEDLKKIENDVIEFNKQGYRVVSLAVKKNCDKIEEKDLIFMGYLIFFDKPKKETKKFIESLIERKIDYKILTGDSEIITRQIAAMSNIRIDGVVSGLDLEKFNDDQFRDAVLNNNIFVKLNPLLKSKILVTLQECGKTVGFIGDGINDIAVLRASDVGISFRGASEQAQQAADIVIGDDQLSDLDSAIVKGRQVLCNILKYVNITLASNFGNSISVLIAIIWLAITPMQPIQLLTQNLIYDIAQMALVLDRVDDSFIEKPRKINVKSMLTFCLITGPLSSLFDFLTFVTLVYFYKYIDPSQKGNINPSNLTLFQSSWFIVGLLTQTAVVYIFRTEYNNIFKTKPCKTLLCMSAGVIILAYGIPYTPYVSELFSMSTPKPSFVLFTLLFLGSYIGLSMLVKFIYIKLFKTIW